MGRLGAARAWAARDVDGAHRNLGTLEAGFDRAGAVIRRQRTVVVTVKRRGVRLRFGAGDRGHRITRMGEVYCAGRYVDRLAVLARRVAHDPQVVDRPELSTEGYAGEGDRERLERSAPSSAARPGHPSSLRRAELPVKPQARTHTPGRPGQGPMATFSAGTASLRLPSRARAGPRASNRRASIPREQRRPVTSEPGVHHDLVLIDQTQLRQGQGELHACHEQSLSRLPLELGNGPYVPKGPPWPGEDQSWSPAAFFPAWLRAARAARAQLAAAERPASTVRGPVVHSPPVTVSAHENISQACTAHGRMPPLPGSATPMRRTSPSSSGR